MAEPATPRSSIRFGIFDVDLRTRELRKAGVKVKLQEQPFQVLETLLEHGGGLVTKDELKRRIWPADTFVDFDHGLYSAITRLREALGDSAESPRFIETLARRGYRFIVPIDEIDTSPRTDGTASPPVQHAEPIEHAPASTRPYIALSWMAAGLVVAIGVAAALTSRGRVPTSIAVLPFANKAGTEFAGYLTEGIVRSVTDSLSNVSSPLLRVKARSLSAAYQGRTVDPVTAGRELGVDVVLVGHVSQAQGELAIQTELVRVSDGSQLWGTSYPDQDLVSVTFTQQDIASSVAGHLPVSLTADELKRVPKPLTTSAQAEDLASRAKTLCDRASPDTLAACIERSQQAIDLDPGYAFPYGVIAAAYSISGLTDVIPPREAHEKTLYWSTKAIQINDSVYTSRMALLGEQATYEWDWSAIARAGHAHPFYRDYLRATGQVDRLVDLMTGLVRDDPDSIFWGYFLGEALYLNRQYDAAIARFEQTTERDPTFLWSRLGLAKAYLQKNRFGDAIAELKAAQALRRSSGWLGYAYARMGQRAEALGILADLKQQSVREYVSPLRIAWIYLGLGDTAQTFSWMRQACDTRVPIFNEIKVEPAYDPIRGDPRFDDLLRCAGVDDPSLARLVATQPVQAQPAR